MRHRHEVTRHYTDRCRQRNIALNAHVYVRNFGVRVWPAGAHCRKYHLHPRRAQEVMQASQGRLDLESFVGVTVVFDLNGVAITAYREERDD